MGIKYHKFCSYIPYPLGLMDYEECGQKFIIEMNHITPYKRLGQTQICILPVLSPTPAFVLKKALHVPLESQKHGIECS